MGDQDSDTEMGLDKVQDLLKKYETAESDSSDVRIVSKKANFAQDGISQRADVESNVGSPVRVDEGSHGMNPDEEAEGQPLRAVHKYTSTPQWTCGLERLRICVL